MIAEILIKKEITETYFGSSSVAIFVKNGMILQVL